MATLVSMGSATTADVKRQPVPTGRSWRALSPSGFQSGTLSRPGGTPTRGPTDQTRRPSRCDFTHLWLFVFM